PAGIARDVGAPGLLVRLDAATSAGPVDQADDRQPQLPGHALAVDLLSVDAGVGRAATHGEVVAADDHAPAADASRPEDRVSREKAVELAVLVRRLAGQRAGLGERAAVEQLLDPLAHAEAAGLVLALDVVRAAHAARQLVAAPELLDLFFPAHTAPFSRNHSAPSLGPARAAGGPDGRAQEIDQALRRRWQPPRHHDHRGRRRPKSPVALSGHRLARLTRGPSPRGQGESPCPWPGVGRKPALC